MKSTWRMQWKCILPSVSLSYNFFTQWHKTPIYLKQPLWSHLIPSLPPRGGGGLGYSHIWAIWGCAAQQGMVFASLSLEQGLKIRAFLSGTGYTFCHSDPGARSGLLFCGQNRAASERCCCSRLAPAACLLKPAVFRFSGQPHLTFFSLEQGIYFHDFVTKLRLFSLEQGQVPRHSVALPPILN